MRLFAVLLIFLVPFACAQDGSLVPSAKLPKKLNECSGMTTFDGETLWVIEDSGNADNLYGVDTTGSIVATFEVSNAKNKDWEALAHDTLGNLYIGDFGNNRSDRKNLKIYKLPNPHEEKGDKIPAEKILFKYPDQELFPPPFSERRFDAEAFFHFGDRLYIITKNRGDPFNGKAYIYSVPDKPGEYTARMEMQFSTCQKRRSCVITDAALSPDGSRLVLLGYGKIWIFEDFSNQGFGNGPDRVLDLGASTQLEAICFVSNDMLYLADERVMKSGGNLYAYPLP